jgi:hypothetical protein
MMHAYVSQLQKNTSVTDATLITGTRTVHSREVDDNALVKGVGEFAAGLLGEVLADPTVVTPAGYYLVCVPKRLTLNGVLFAVDEDKTATRGFRLTETLTTDVTRWPPKRSGA